MGLMDSDPAALRAAAARLRQVADSVGAAGQQVRTPVEGWQGPAADRHAIVVQDVGADIDAAACAAMDAASVLANAATTVEAAQQEAAQQAALGAAQQQTLGGPPGSPGEPWLL